MLDYDILCLCYESIIIKFSVICVINLRIILMDFLKNEQFEKSLRPRYPRKLHI